MADSIGGAVARLKDRPAASAALATGLALAGLAISSKIAGESAERRHPPTGRFAEIDGVRVHYLEKGRGPSIVLLHGNGVMAEDFAISGLFDLLAERYHVVALDRPGFGYTERPRDRIWTPTRQAALVAGLIDHLGLSRPIVLGHSWGTIVALALALRIDIDLRGLVLLSGYYFPSARLDVVMSSGPVLPIVGDVLRYTISPLAGRAMAPALFKKIFAPAPVPARFTDYFPTDLTLRPWQIRATSEDATMMVPSAAGLQDEYRRLDLPVAIMAGTGDKIADPERQSARLHREVPGSDLTLLNGLGHMIHYGAAGRIKHAIDMLSRR